MGVGGGSSTFLGVVLRRPIFSCVIWREGCATDHAARRPRPTPHCAGLSCAVAPRCARELDASFLTYLLTGAKRGPRRDGATRLIESRIVLELQSARGIRSAYGSIGTGWRPVKRCEQPDRLVATRVRGRGRTGRLEGLLASLTSGSPHCTGKPRGSGWDSGRTKLPNPRAPPMPSDAD